MTNSLISDRYRSVKSFPIKIWGYSIVGCNPTNLPELILLVAEP